MRFISTVVSLLALSYLLTGCTTASKIEYIPSTEAQERPAFQQELLEPCAPIQLLEVKEYTQQESVEVLQRWAIRYYDCAQKQRALSQLLLDTYK